MGFAGTAVDLGYLEYRQRPQQNAPDSVEIGAAQLVYSDCPNQTASQMLPTTIPRAMASRPLGVAGSPAAARARFPGTYGHEQGPLDSRGERIEAKTQGPGWRFSEHLLRL
jgi:hypothetical protein